MTKLTVLLTCAALMPIAAFAQDTPGSHFVENWDLDGNGSVSSEEITERRGDIFVMFDQDEDGMLSAEEYVLFDETRAADMENNSGGHGKGGDRMQEGLTLGFNDTDADGQVSKEEFVSNSAAWFTQIDRNGDAMITSADFGPQSN
ncbi:MAG: EF-hand domain-containing protein [Loktanella sp.]|nr:EF-hand domain-containing protein [Loktanella sp.]